MIIAALLFLISNFIVGLLSILPTGSLPVAIGTSLTYIVGVMNTFNFLFPIDTLFSVLAIVIAFETAILLFHIIEWIYHKIRG